MPSSYLAPPKNRASKARGHLTQLQVGMPDIIRNCSLCPLSFCISFPATQVVYTNNVIANSTICTRAELLKLQSVFRTSQMWWIFPEAHTQHIFYMLHFHWRYVERLVVVWSSPHHHNITFTGIVLVDGFSCLKYFTNLI